MIKDIFELIKIKQTLLLVISAILSYVLTSSLNINIKVLILLLISSFLAVSSATIANMVIDVDLDRIMFRTRNRPLVTGRINISTARYLSIFLLIVAMIIGFMINIYIPILILIGFLINIIIYSKLLKRRTILGIIFGSIAGGLLPLGGSISYCSKLTLGGVLLFLLIYFWSIIHTIYISIYYREDYVKAKIPTFSTVLGNEKSIYISIPILLIIYLISVSYLFMKELFLTINFLTIILIVLLISVYKFIKNKERRTCKIIFKMLNIYVAIFFLVSILELLFKQFM